MSTCWSFSINSVLATGEDSFYVTNLLNAKAGDRFMAYLELIMYIPRSSVVYVKGDNYKTAVDQLSLSNGMTGDNK